MNTKLISTKSNWALIIFLMSGFLASPGIADDNQQCKWTAVDQNSFAEILTMINNRIEENYDRIKTWQGKVNIVIDIVSESENAKRLSEKILVDEPVPNGIIDHQELTNEFALDVNKGLLYDNIYPDAKRNIIDAQTGKILRLNENAQIRSKKNIRTPDCQLTCREYKNREGVIVRRWVVKEKRPAGELTNRDSLPPVFDPRETMRIFGDIKRKSFAPLGGAFAKYLAFLDKKERNSIDGFPTVVVKECDVGNVKKYKIDLLGLSNDSDGSKIHFYYNLVCSSEAGFNVVSFSITDEKKRVVEDKELEYGLFDGVYLPKVINQHQFKEDGKLENEKRYTFNKDQKVNKPLSEETFTYKNLALKNGDQFIDKIADKEYKYQDANLVFIADINATSK